MVKSMALPAPAPATATSSPRLRTDRAPAPNLRIASRAAQRTARMQPARAHANNLAPRSAPPAPATSLHGLKGVWVFVESKTL